MICMQCEKYYYAKEEPGVCKGRLVDSGATSDLDALKGRRIRARKLGFRFKSAQRVIRFEGRSLPMMAWTVREAPVERLCQVVATESGRPIAETIDL